MKVSVSLPDEDVVFLDELATRQGFGSRSAVVQKAVRLLRSASLANAYEDAWNEWQSGDDASLWDSASADGLIS